MHLKSRRLGKRARLALGALLALFVMGFAGTVRGADLVPFTGEKSSWHGFDRYDFLMDEQTFEVKPASAKGESREGAAAVHRGRSENRGGRQPVVLARLLLGPRTADGS